MRTYDFFGSHKDALGGTETIIFGSNEVPSRGLVSLYVSTSITAASGFDDFAGVRVKADGVPILDLSNAQLSTYLGRFSKVNHAPGAARQAWSIPLCILDADGGQEEGDTCQFPPGAQISVELDFTNLVAGDDVTLGWAQNFDAAPRFHRRTIGVPAAIPASSVNARYNIPGDRGLLRAIAWPITGVVRAALYINERRILNAPGSSWRANSGAILGELQMPETGLNAGGLNTDPCWLKFDTGQPIVPGASYLELETAAAWAGVANEVVTDVLVPLA